MIVDSIAQAFYEMKFELAFLKKKGNEYQDFFSSIMEKRYPGDFIRVRPWGSIGDRKNDGYLSSKRMLFQSYAPNEISAAECVAKIEEDFNGALPHWEAYFDAWTFVHNSPSGLGPDVVAKLLELKTMHSHIDTAPWGFEELRQEAMLLSDIHLASLFGPAPSRAGIVNLALGDLIPILDHIARLPAASDPDLRPVPSDKLEKNQLSPHVGTLLRAGMTRVDLVKKYFAFKHGLQDQLAATFNSQYLLLRSTEAAPDEIFAELQRFAGGTLVASAAQQSGVLAVLAFFFEECDIFERPDSSSGGAP